MKSNERRPIRRLLPAIAALSLLALSGCVAYPAGYGYAPGYAYAPAPYVYAPPVAVGVGVGCCWGGYHGWSGHWR